jgi:hypothetical protein
LGVGRISPLISVLLKIYGYELLYEYAIFMDLIHGEPYLTPFTAFGGLHGGFGFLLHACGGDREIHRFSSTYNKLVTAVLLIRPCAWSINNKTIKQFIFNLNPFAV